MSVTGFKTLKRLLYQAMLTVLLMLLSVLAGASPVWPQDQEPKEAPGSSEPAKELPKENQGGAGNVVEGGVQPENPVGPENSNPDWKAAKEPEMEAATAEKPDRRGIRNIAESPAQGHSGGEDPNGENMVFEFQGPTIVEKPAHSEAGVGDSPIPSSGERPVTALPPRELPPFAQGQPGFIPDTTPGDLFSQPDLQKYEFESFLGPSHLPGGDVDELLSRHARNPESQLKDNYARVVVPNGTIEGSTETKQFHIEGGLVIYYSDVTISGDVADIDEKNEVAVLYGNVNIVDPKYTLKTDELRIYFNDKQLQATGFVQFTKVTDRTKQEPDMSLSKKDRLREHFSGQEFKLFCADLYYDWDKSEMAAVGSVRLVHPSFNGTMDRLDYNDETKDYVIDGTVILEVTDYDWILANKLVEEEDEQKITAITDGATKITCDRVVYSEETGIAQFYALAGAKVTFHQPGRDVVADYIEVNDSTKDFYAEGSEASKVNFNQKDGQWLFEGGIIDEEGVSDDIREMLGGPMDVFSTTLAYNFDRKRLELIGGVSIDGSGRSMLADTVIQDETASYFLLRGNVQLKPDANSTIYAAQVFVDTENDTFTFVGLVEGKIKSDEIPTSEKTESSEIQIQQGVFQQVGTGPTGQGSNTTNRGTGSNIASGDQ